MARRGCGNLALVHLVSIIGASAVPATALMPRFGWDTIANQSFYHSANTTGPYAPEAVDIIARFPIVTFEKWQAIKQPGHSHMQLANIVAAARTVKAVNPSTVTIFYYNSVCDFPQYSDASSDLYGQFNAMPEGWLRDANNDTVYMSCAGWSKMPVFDFGQKAVRDLWASECVNATKSGVIDGCFSDRAVDGVPTSKLSPSTLSAYLAGHVQVHVDLQKSIGNAPLIANHAYGPPFDTMPTSVNAAMIESCKGDNTTINQLLACAANGKLCECHVEGGHMNETLAAYLIGAYRLDSGTGSYFGFGAWDSGDAYTPAWDDVVWPDFFSYPLGVPEGPATLTNGTLWTRNFRNSEGTTSVWFDASKNSGCVNWAGLPPCGMPPTPPTPPAPTKQCPVVYLGGISNHDIGQKTMDSWEDCCASCGSTQGCVGWTFYTDGTNACHHHSSTTGRNANPQRISGFMHA